MRAGKQKQSKVHKSIEDTNMAKSILISGPDFIYSAAHRGIVRLVARGITLYLIDGANLLDVYFLIREAESMGIPADIFLSKVKVARAFNPFQVVSIIEKVPERSIVVILGPISLLTDKNDGLSYRESLKVLSGIRDKLLPRKAVFLLIQKLPSKNGPLLDKLARFTGFKVLINGGVIMGRTIMPYSMTMELQKERLKKFKRALRKEDQEYLDEIFKYAKKHVQAGSYAAFPDPIIPVFLSAFIEQEKKIRELEKRVKALENGIPL